MKLKKMPGYSLMEILVATTIFTGAMILVAGAFAGSIKNQIKAVRERKIAQEARLFEETLARKIREATGKGKYYQLPLQTPGEYEIFTVEGLIALSNFRPKEEADVLVLFKPDEIEVLKLVSEADGKLKIKSLIFSGKNSVFSSEIAGFDTNPDTQTLFPQESNLLFEGSAFPFNVESKVDGTTYQNSLVTLTGQVSTNSAQCLNNNRDACMNLETKISTREGIKL